MGHGSLVDKPDLGIEVSPCPLVGAGTGNSRAATITSNSSDILYGNGLPNESAILASPPFLMEDAVPYNTPTIEPVAPLITSSGDTYQGRSESLALHAHWTSNGNDVLDQPRDRSGTKQIDHMSKSISQFLPVDNNAIAEDSSIPRIADNRGNSHFDSNIILDSAQDLEVHDPATFPAYPAQGGEEHQPGDEIGRFVAEEQQISRQSTVSPDINSPTTPATSPSSFRCIHCGKMFSTRGRLK